MADTSPAEQLPLQTTVSSFGRWVLLGTSLLQAVSPVFFQFNGTSNDPAFVPPGYFFSIWGIIIAGSIAIAIRGLSAQRGASLPYRRIQIPLSVVHLGFVAWLTAATSPGPWIPLTLPIFLVMLAGLAVCLRELQGSPPATIDGASQAILGTGLGLYAGWSTAAVWLNAATLIPPNAFNGDSGAILQCLFVGGAAVSAAVGTYLLRGLAVYSYLIAAGWALIGVTVSGISQGALPAAITAGIGLVVVTLAALF